MKRIYLVITVALLLISGMTVRHHALAVADISTDREKAAQLLSDGNFNDAYQLLRQLCLSEDAEGAELASDYTRAVVCLNQLGRLAEFDKFSEQTVATHQQDWQLLRAVADQYLSVMHWGHRVAGEYERGPRRGGGVVANSQQRDRVRSLQLYSQAMPMVQAEENGDAAASFQMGMANALLNGNGFADAWRLQYLTDIAVLPDIEEGRPVYLPNMGAPVDEQGQPVFYHEVDSWQQAENDGQRWRWAMAEAVRRNPRFTRDVRWQFASFLHQQFGVQTMQQSQFPMAGMGRRGRDEAGGEPQDGGTYQLHTLSDDETICRLASGIKRLTLPEEFNPIRIFQSLATEQAGNYRNQAQEQLAQIYENRRQYPRAAELWGTIAQRYRQLNNHHSTKRLQQIIGNWGTIEGVGDLSAGNSVEFGFRYRNGKKVTFTAKRILVDKLLTDLKEYLKSNPQRLDWQEVQIGQLGYRLIHNNQEKYVGEQVASWSVQLKPRPQHFDSRLTVESPLDQGGAYLLTSKMENGNETHVVLWVDNTSIIRKQLSDQNYYFFADARTGVPIDDLEVDFFGFRQERKENNVFQVLTRNFVEKTDAQGQVFPSKPQLSDQYQWLIVARNKQGRMAHVGFSGVWTGRHHDEQYNATRIFCITDRPVYRPGHKVQYSAWVRHSQYDKEHDSQFAGKSFLVRIFNPRNEKLVELNLTADDFGGLQGELELPEDATLGAYRIEILSGNNRPRASGGNSFRVEEYKKPEYEVTIDAPSEPVMLGELVKATVHARYYFGSPVTEATVKIRVMRSDYQQNWYPIAPWDWCFEPGYWWFCYDYPWYPGFGTWSGCMQPFPWWWSQQMTPPELVMELETDIRPDGTVEVEIDTALAEALYGNSDHKYEITAEVRDQSRRTIVGQSNVLVARQPFKIFSWTENGYYKVGDTIQARFQAQTLDEKPVEGKGTLRLLKISYDRRGKPVETTVRSWDMETDATGSASQQIAASAAGQYRLSLEITDSLGHTIEGGYILTIVGDGFDGRKYRFNNLELIPDKQQYQDGDTVRLQINTNRADSTVLLFVRPSNGVYLKPRVLQLKGKSTIEEIPVTKKDMPNFFVEAVTISNGQVHMEVKQIIVPPEERILQVDVIPNAEVYKPGDEAQLRVHLTDANGENFQGSTVISVYDKSVEYISGGSNVPEIREFFWKWRRNHHPSTESNLNRHEPIIVKQGHDAMQPIGIFGRNVAEEMQAVENGRQRDGRVQKTMMMGGMGGGGDMEGVAEMADSAMAMPGPGGPGLAAAVGNSRSAEGLPVNQQGNGALEQPAVRSNFADTALWVGAVTTDATGIADVSFQLPESLTTWKINAWGMGHGTRVGEAHTEVITRKNVILRLQAPRFFVQKDEVVLSANVHNYLPDDKDIRVTLELDGEELVSLDPVTINVRVEANGERRVDWRVRVEREGMATVRMLALTDEESDAVEMQLPCHVHGILKTESWAGTIRPDEDSSLVSISVPTERRVDESVLEIRYSPTLAGAMVDALPYMADFPYGCTEQTLNRFLPSVITQKILLDMNLNLAEIQEKRTNLNAQEIGNDQQRAAQWKRFDRNPVFDEDELDRMVREGVKRLTSMQIGDGGWGWFSGRGERSYPHTTCVVVHGLQIAQQNDVTMPPGVLDRGIAWLKRYQAQQVQMLKNAPTTTDPWKDKAGNLDAMVYMVLVDAQLENAEMREFLYRDRVALAVYSKAMFALALERGEHKEQLDMLVRNIEQFLVQDEENETAYLRLPEGHSWWYWHGSEIEANAYYLKLLARVKPESVQASRLVKYLLNNRKHATYWKSTRDTAICIEAFGEYLRASGETKPDMVVEVWIDGEKRQEVAINEGNLFTFDNKFVISGEAVTDGAHEIQLRRRGQGPVYFNAYLTNFTLEDHITAAGLEVKVQRRYYKLVAVEQEIPVPGQRGQPIGQRVPKYERVPIENLGVVTSGDLVEVELEIESKNDYEYVIFEDRKAAGFEAVDLRSGYNNRGLRSYREMRDDRVAFFLQQLPRGRHSVSYRLRAEIPGTFSALPTIAKAMYAPELRGNSDEIKVRIVDTE